jgi:hypothetical protein
MKRIRQRVRELTERHRWAGMRDLREVVLSGSCVAMPRRPSVSRVRENRTHGLKGGCGNGRACHAPRR